MVHPIVWFPTHPLIWGHCPQSCHSVVRPTSLLSNPFPCHWTHLPMIMPIVPSSDPSHCLLMPLNPSRHHQICLAVIESLSLLLNPLHHWICLGIMEPISLSAFIIVGFPMPVLHHCILCTAAVGHGIIIIGWWRGGGCLAVHVTCICCHCYHSLFIILGSCCHVIVG